MKKWGCLFAALFLFLVVTGALTLLSPLFFLAVGWVASFQRLWSAWHIEPESVVRFALALIILVFGSHLFLQWLYGAVKGRNAGGVELGKSWRWKWTLVGFGMLSCAFVAIISFVLTSHQIFWMSRSSEPWFVNRYAYKGALSKGIHHLREAGESHQWNGASMRKAFWEITSSGGTGIGELIQPIWIEQDGGTIKAVVLVPRRNIQADRVHLAVLQSNDCSYCPTRELPSVLASFGITNAARPVGKNTELLP